MSAKYPYQINDEPVPGYRVVKFLGNGNFGEVWQARAPGGASVALKIVPDLSGKQAHKEFRALGIIKDLHHPNLVSINAVWLKDGEGQILDDSMAASDSLPPGFGGFDSAKATVVAGVLGASDPSRCELLIAMGLGSKNLFSRLEECRAQGQTGIPPEELLNYMEESAKAIDYLNHDSLETGTKRLGVQHCDIKPHNILIVGTSAQVCDFGLARVQGEIRATNSMAATVAYAAPECLEKGGDPSPTTDQYSLAITYYELRTGRLPYGDDDSLYQVMQASLAGNLDLSGVPDAEQRILRQATARNPSERFTSTVAMVRALRRAVEGPSGATTVDLLRPGAQRKRVPWGVALLALALLTGGAAWWMLQTPGPPPGREKASDEPPADVAAATPNVPLPAETASTDTTPAETPASESLATVPPADAEQEKMPSRAEQAEKRIAAARQWADAGKTEEAIAEYGRAIELSPVSAEAWFGRGLVHWKNQALDPAIADFERAVALDRDGSRGLRQREEPARALLTRAAQRRQQGDFSGAIADCTTVISKFPSGEADALTERGAVRRDQGDLAGAAEDLSDAIRLEPRLGLALSRRGYVYLRLRRFDEALKDLDAALYLEPNDIDYLNRAIVYSATAKSEQALKELNGLIERDAQNADALYQRGLVYRDQQNYAAAIADFRATLRLEPQRADALAALALLLASAPQATPEDGAEALQLAEQAVSLSQRKDANHLDALAAAQAKAGQYERAVVTEQAALELAQGSPSEAGYKERLALYQAGQPLVLPAPPAAE